jgi:hypothetical protein
MRLDQESGPGTGLKGKRAGPRGLWWNLWGSCCCCVWLTRTTVQGPDQEQILLFLRKSSRLPHCPDERLRAGFRAVAGTGRRPAQVPAGSPIPR